MKKSIFKSLTFAGIGSFCAFATNAGTSLFSDYGQIQNVQNYSSNPFWTPNAPYNQRLPQPVYVQGADLNTDDCIRAVQSLISVQCMARNNCKNTALNEIRPEIMVQLSKLPGNNYVSACSGYIDSIFESYVAQYGNNAPNRVTAFPSATTPNQNINENTGLQLKNPYKQTTTKAQQAVNQRSAELQRLQQQNGAGSEHLSSTEFPKTFEDLSFAQRVAFKAEDYEQYKGSKTYAELNPIGADEWCNDHPNTPECRAWRDCTEEMKKTVPHLVRAEYDDKRICRVKECDPGWQPNNTATTCEEIKNPGGDCMDQITNTDHVLAATINSSGKCEVTCESGWHPKEPLKLECEEDAPTPNSDCLSKIKPSEPRATKAEYDAFGVCKIIECENDWHPDPSGLKCIQDEYYYSMAVYSAGLAIPYVRLPAGPHPLADDDNLCYAVCGIRTAGDDVNEKVLYPILHNRFCTPNKNTYATDIFSGRTTELPELILKDVNTGNPIKINEVQKSNIVNALIQIDDKHMEDGACDGKVYNIEVRIFKYKTSDNSFVEVSDNLTLDD